MIPGLVGELGELDSPLRDLSALVAARNAAVDLVDADVVEAVARAIEAGTTWGALAEALRGNDFTQAKPPRTDAARRAPLMRAT
jgi:hypothetical protein